MGSLLITPFSCTLKPTLQINMKVFATLATVLGASATAPVNQMHGSNNMRMDQHSMKPSMGMPMESRMTQHGMSDRHMVMNRHMSNMRDTYRVNQHMMSQDMSPNMIGQDMSHNMMAKEMGQNMMGQDMRSNMRDMYRNNQDMTSNMVGQKMSHNMMGQDMRSNIRNMQSQAFGPNQYFKKDDFGNYVYSYNDQQSEKSEEGNDQFTKGQYAYIMSNGVKRKVEYIADNNGFHIIKDNADPARIKRSTEPELLQTRMISMMGSPSLRDESRDMYRMSDMMGRDMPSNLGRNLMGMQQQRYSSMMGQETTGHNMMGQNTLEHNMMDRDSMLPNLMGQNIYSTMSNRGMPSDVSDRMGQHRNSNMMGQDTTMNRMGGNMMRLDRNSQMMGMLANQDMAPTTLYSNIMGQDMMDVS